MTHVNGVRLPEHLHAVARAAEVMVSHEVKASGASGNRVHRVIDGKWLRGVGDGQVKLFAAMLHEEKMIIARQRETAEYIAGRAEDGGREHGHGHGHIIKRSLAGNRHRTTAAGSELRR